MRREKEKNSQAGACEITVTDGVVEMPMCTNQALSSKIMILHDAAKLSFILLFFRLLEFSLRARTMLQEVCKAVLYWNPESRRWLN
jgi:hypothetical protein